jgi:hypothetical protein
MKKKFLGACCFFLLATACNTTSNGGSQPEADSVEAKVEPKIVEPAVIKESEFFYDFDSTSAILVSDPIVYEVVVKNHETDDDWEEERLAKTNVLPLANAVFQAIYKGRVKAYDYFTEEEMSVDEIKKLEKEFNRKEIGNIMFEEKWYFNEKTMTFTKKIKSLTFGYELREPKTKDFQGFKAAFKVNLN